MTRTDTGSRATIIIIVLAVAGVLITAGVIGTQSLPDAGPSAGSDADAPHAGAPKANRWDDGSLPDGAGPHDDYPGITTLDPDLLAAVRAASDDAAAEGVTVQINAGWRSAAYQQRLIDEAIETYGGWGEAKRWVATVEGSAHTSGEAVDIGDFDAAAWFQENGAHYDLCQIFDNEAWHFELRPGAATDGCPRKYWDASDDPRNQ